MVNAFFLAGAPTDANLSVSRPSLLLENSLVLDPTSLLLDFIWQAAISKLHQAVGSLKLPYFQLHMSINMRCNTTTCEFHLKQEEEHLAIIVFGQPLQPHS